MSELSASSQPDPREYGDSYRADFLGIYHEYVASADRISERRNAANTFFSTANSALLGLHGYFQAGGEAAGLHIDDRIWMPALAGVLLCLVWRSLILSYKRLNGAKFAVILDLEKALPAAPYTEEWAHLQNPDLGKSHIAISDSEKWVPVLFMLLNGLLAALSLQQFIWH